MPTATRQPAGDDATVSGSSALADTSLGTFGPYELRQLIAVGGMGVVYRAFDTRLRREVALKRLIQGRRRDDAQRFRQEARVISELEHPNIIEVFEFDEINGQSYFTMHLAEGGNVGDCLHRYTDDPRAAAELVEKVARAVHFAHERGVLHRDLKPTNILLDKNGDPLVSDFGLAKLLDEDAGITTTGALLGTPAYMSPEQARGSLDKIDRATDVWAIGVILYELLTGTRPYPGKSRAEVLPKILSDEVPAPKSVRRSIPQPLADIVMKCLARDPRDRYATAEAIANHLTKWIAGQPFRIRRRPRTVAGRLLQHPLRRREVLVAGAVGAVGAALAWALPEMIGREAHAEKRTLAELHETLHRYDRATLIPEAGVPKFARNVVGQPRISLKEDTYTVAVDEPTLIELLPEPPLHHYRLEAQVRHRSANSGHVGIYVGRVGPVDGRHWFYSAIFADLGRSAHLPHADGRKDSSRAGIALASADVTGRKGRGASFTPASTLFEPVDDPTPWRKLMLDVSPEGVEVTWENKPLGKVPGSELFQHATVGPGVHLPIPAFAPNQGLGLYIEDGAASFRNVILKDLNPAKPPIPERP